MGWGTQEAGCFVCLLRVDEELPQAGHRTSPPRRKSQDDSASLRCWGPNRATQVSGWCRFMRLKGGQTVKPFEPHRLQPEGLTATVDHLTSQRERCLPATRSLTITLIRLLTSRNSKFQQLKPERDGNSFDDHLAP